MVFPNRHRGTTADIPTSVVADVAPVAALDIDTSSPVRPKLINTTTTTTTESGGLSSPSNRSLGKGIFSPAGSVQEFDVSPLPSPSSSPSSSNATDMKASKGGRGGCSLSLPALRHATTTPALSTPSPEKPQQSTSNNNKRPSLSLMAKLKESSEKIILSSKPFQRHLSSFLRVADLLSHMDEIDGTDTLYSDVSSEKEGGEVVYPNYHHASIDPPPGMETDPQERWISLDDGDRKHSPIAPVAIRALAKSGLKSTFDQSMWQPADKATTKLLSQQSASEWKTCAWQDQGPVIALPTGKNQDAVLVWSGSFQHGLYGSELPAVRATGVVDMSPSDLLDLLVDSDRVKEYNKLSLGRTDELVLQENYTVGPFGGITKVMKSISRPPLVRKTLLFTSILHARELSDKSGYKIVTRAVTTANDNGNNQQQHDNSNKHSDVLTSEILMGVTIIKRIEGSESNENKSLVITVNHIRSPMLPMMIAKRIGLQAASSFIHDLRSAAAANNNQH